MAARKQSGRQKMINLMYLVFIAMLALNMSKKVLSSFGYLNEKLVETNNNVSSEIKFILDDLNLKASEQPDKYHELNKKAIQVYALSNSFYQYLGNIKDTLLLDFELESHKDYEIMDSENAGDEYFFKGEVLTKNGSEFIHRINKYRDTIKTILGATLNQDILKNLNKRFNTSVQLVNGGKEPWIRNRYEGFPLIATLTNLSVIQSDIRATEKEIYNSLLGKQLSKDASISENTYKAIVLANKPAYFPGEKVEGTIVLGRYDADLKPDKVIINGKEVKDRLDGAAVLNFKAGKVGENPIKGRFLFKQGGELVEIPIESSYLVIPKPNSAVVSADKMNVVYRGVENPMTISIPGVSDNKISAMATGLTKTKGVGKYILSPGKGKDVTINVSGKTNDGTVIKSPPIKFRIKDIPPSVASIRKEYGAIRLPKSSLSKATILAELIDFDFDLKLSVSSFKIKMPRQSTVVVNGNKLDARAKKSLLKAKRGDVINIFDVKANIIGNSNYKLKQALPLSIELIN